jgi:hypothetical protein
MGRGNVKTMFKPSNLPLILIAAWRLLLYAAPYLGELLHKDNESYREFSSVKWIPANRPTNNKQKWFCIASWGEKSEKANGSLSHTLLCSFFKFKLWHMLAKTVCVRLCTKKKKHKFLCIHAKLYFQIFPTAHKFLAPNLDWQNYYKTNFGFITKTNLTGNNFILWLLSFGMWHRVAWQVHWHFRLEE